MPPKTADPVDPVDVIVTNADISTVIIKHGASKKEIIMKYVIKKLIKHIEIYWNRTYSNKIDVDILALMTEKYASSKSFPEFMQMHQHVIGNLPAAMGHSNRQKPDGVIQFKFNNHICHLFIEIDADNKNNKKQKEALKIWQDISCSVEGQSSNTSPGESISACVMRINSNSINCSGVRHAAVKKTEASRQSTVPMSTEAEPDEIIGDEHKELQKSYDTRHIDEVKQVFVTMHTAFARQITRVILAWLGYVFDPKEKIKSAISTWMKSGTLKKRNDFCFWIGEYQLNNVKNYTTLETQDLYTFSENWEEKLGNKWTQILNNVEFNQTDIEEFKQEFQSANIVDNTSITLTEDDVKNLPFKVFYSTNHSWKQENKMSQFTKNMVRTQGHWFRQLEAMQNHYRDDNDAISNWIENNQMPVMSFKTDVEPTQGDYQEHTRIKFTNTRNDKCQFEITIGVFAIKIPRVCTEDFQAALNNFCDNDSKTYTARKDWNPSTFTQTHQTNLKNIWLSIRDSLRARYLLDINSSSRNDYIDWITYQMEVFTKARNDKYKNTIGKLPGMWYSKHIAMICSKILNEKEPINREYIAHILFKNSRRDDDLLELQPNSLPLSTLWGDSKPAMDWNIKKLREHGGLHLIPMLWEPLSGMLINSLYFLVRNIKQNSPDGEKNFEMKRTQIRSTAYVYRSINKLMEADAIMPDLLAGHDPDRISSDSQNLNTLMLKSIFNKELKKEFSESLKKYLEKLKSEHCVAFCKLIRCTDDSMLHWTAKMYQNEAFKEEISRIIRLFPLAGQAMILRMLAEAADDNPVVWKSNIDVQEVNHTVGKRNHAWIEVELNDDQKKNPLQLLMTTMLKDENQLWITHNKSNPKKVLLDNEKISNGDYIEFDNDDGKNRATFYLPSTFSKKGDTIQLVPKITIDARICVIDMKYYNEKVKIIDEDIQQYSITTQKSPAIYCAVLWVYKKFVLDVEDGEHEEEGDGNYMGSDEE